jgi:hypothetical protein
VLIERVDRIGGVWKYRTTSWNTVNAILSSLALVKTVTGGPLAGIPLHLVLSPKTVTVPTTGQSMLVYVVSLEFRGTESQLAELGYDIARKRMEHRVKMEQIEAEARARLLPPQQEPLQEQEETAQEFYPEWVEGPVTSVPEPVVSPAQEDPKSKGNGKRSKKAKAQDIGPCHYHPDRRATWQDEAGMPRCEGCEPPVIQQREGGLATDTTAPPPPPSGEGQEALPQPKTLF